MDALRHCYISGHFAVVDDDDEVLVSELARFAPLPLPDSTDPLVPVNNITLQLDRYPKPIRFFIVVFCLLMLVIAMAISRSISAATILPPTCLSTFGILPSD